MVSSSDKRIYFKGLHALRFFAALLVLISHMEMIKGGLKISNIYGNSSFLSHALESLGPFGVTFFFVLSGFLITYLLLAEKINTNHINIRKFYWRRVLRIWPIYIVFTLIAFFLLPEMDWFYHYFFTPQIGEDMGTKLLMYLIFIPGFALAFYPSIPWAGHLWSIGVEEQFYLAWPWFFKKFKMVELKHFWFLLVSIISVKIIMLILFNFGVTSLAVKEIVAQSKFECMIIGGMGAFYIFVNNGLRKCQFVKKQATVPLTIAAAILLTWFCPKVLNSAIHLILSPLFLIIILGTSWGSKGKWMESPLFIKLGNLSYSIYLLHMVGAVIALRIFSDINGFYLGLETGSFTFNAIVYSLAVLITILLSMISYQIIERPFLRLKTKFAVIKSGK